MLILGIDPGLSGAVAMLTSYDKTVRLWDTPTVVVTMSSGKQRRDYRVADMAAILESILRTTSADEVCVAIEQVTAMPDQGVTSMFNMGRGLGLWEGLLAAYRLTYTKVRPQTWKKVMLADMGKDKASSILRAQQLFPLADITLKKHDGRAEALLLAQYGRTILGATPPATR